MGRWRIENFNFPALRHSKHSSTLMGEVEDEDDDEDEGGAAGKDCYLRPRNKITRSITKSSTIVTSRISIQRLVWSWLRS